MPETRPFSCRGLAVALVVFALTASLATRVFHGSTGSKAEVSSTSDYQKVQHRDKDAIEWAPPTAELCVFWVSEPSAVPENSETVHVRLHHDSLYNRPPPLA